jgi:hypothetical protein
VVLDEVAKQLVAVPELKIEIAGHTDSRGTRIRNIRLSLSRAEAVRAYLVMQGVAASAPYNGSQYVAFTATMFSGRDSNTPRTSRPNRNSPKGSAPLLNCCQTR